MSYEKNTWNKGDVITSAKLNHMEDGIAGAGGVLIVNGTIDGSTMTLDHTWQEIYDAGAAVLHYTPPIEGGYNCALLSAIFVESNQYTCNFDVSQVTIAFVTDSPDGYPSTTES